MRQERSQMPRSKLQVQANILPTPQTTPQRIGPSLHQAPTAAKCQANGYSVSNLPPQAQKHSLPRSILKAAQAPACPPTSQSWRVLDAPPRAAPLQNPPHP